ncbi:hypothetical protein [Streptomyces mirabilis]|uniref:hypothetical protein n=1 Tax=Streptomyces mirabilis TaxID=68239 RepID=UPI00368B0EC0
MVWWHDWLITFLLIGGLACLHSIDGYVSHRFNQTRDPDAALDPLTQGRTVVTSVAALVGLVSCPRGSRALPLRDLLLIAVVGVSRRGWPLPRCRLPVTRIGNLAIMAVLVGLPFLLLAGSTCPAAGPASGALTLVSRAPCCKRAE